MTIERLEALAEASTPGTWRTSIGRFGVGALAADRPALLLAEIRPDGARDVVFAESHADAALIAAAVNALPALLDVAEAARAVRAPDGFVFASDPKERTVLAQSVVRRVLGAALDRLDGAS